MAITDSYGNEIKARIPEVVGVRATGSTIIVEILRPEEILGTTLLVGENTNAGAPQAYVMDIGPFVDEKSGIHIGDRVIMSGNYTPLPESASKTGRKLGSIESHAIKAILIEQE